MLLLLLITLSLRPPRIAVANPAVFRSLVDMVLLNVLFGIVLILCHVGSADLLRAQAEWFPALRLHPSEAISSPADKDFAPMAFNLINKTCDDFEEIYSGVQQRGVFFIVAERRSRAIFKIA